MAINLTRYNISEDRFDANVSLFDDSQIPFSVSMWINLQSYASIHNLLCAGDSITDVREIYVNINGNLAFYSTSAKHIIHSTAMSLNTWYHIGLYENANATDTRELFLNGIKSTTGGKDGATNLTTTVASLGVYPYLGSFRYPSNALYAGMAIWNKQLADEEFAILAAGALPTSVSPSSLSNYWPLNLDTLTNSVRDVIGGANLNAAAHEVFKGGEKNIRPWPGQQWG